MENLHNLSRFNLSSLKKIIESLTITTKMSLSSVLIVKISRLEMRRMVWVWKEKVFRLFLQMWTVESCRNNF